MKLSIEWKRFYLEARMATIGPGVFSIPSSVLTGTLAGSLTPPSLPTSVAMPAQETQGKRPQNRAAQAKKHIGLEDTQVIEEEKRGQYNGRQKPRVIRSNRGNENLFIGRHNDEEKQRTRQSGFPWRVALKTL